MLPDEILGSEEQKERFISTFQDPFKKGCIKKIWFMIGEDIFHEGVIIYECDIKFKSGNTKGEHFIEAEDFPSLIKKAEDFIKSLENNDSTPNQE